MYSNTQRTNERRPSAAPDADMRDRPGVPMETEPHPAGAAHWREPEPMTPRVPVLKRAALDHLTPVFSNDEPPRLLSGWMRRRAYAIPEHRVSHWALLLLADRVDVLEHRLPRALPLALMLGVGTWAVVRAARR